MLEIFYRGGIPPSANRLAAAVTRLGPAEWLSLAAAPTFAVMALLTALSGGRPQMLCSAMPGGSLLGGMTPMYLLMCAFHAAPWLKLIARRRDHP